MPRIKVDVYDAKNLEAKDTNGKSDPYVVIEFTGIEKMRHNRTPVVKNNLNPVWNISFDFEVPTLGRIEFHVFDHDVIGKDDELGVAIVPLMDFAPMEARHLLLELSQGTLRVKVTMDNCDPRAFKHEGHYDVRGPMFFPHIANMKFRNVIGSMTGKSMVSHVDFGDQDAFLVKPHMWGTEICDLAGDVLMAFKWKMAAVVAYNVHYGSRHGPLLTQVTGNSTADNRKYECQVRALTGAKNRITLHCKWNARKYKVVDTTRNLKLVKFSRTDDTLESMDIRIFVGCDVLLGLAMVMIVHQIRQNEIQAAQNAARMDDMRAGHAYVTY